MSHPDNNCIYVQSAHFGWEQCDLSDLYDLQPTQLKLARENVGMETILNASGSRKFYNSNTGLALGEDSKIKSVLGETIPIKFRQETYDNENYCVWLSTCLLVHSIDKELSNNMIEPYVKN